MVIAPFSQLVSSTWKPKPLKHFSQAGICCLSTFKETCRSSLLERQLLVSSLFLMGFLLGFLMEFSIQQEIWFWSLQTYQPSYHLESQVRVPTWMSQSQLETSWESSHAFQICLVFPRHSYRHQGPQIQSRIQKCFASVILGQISQTSRTKIS